MNRTSGRYRLDAVVRTAFLASFCVCGLLATLAPGRASSADPSALPPLASAPGDAFSPAEQQALLAWVRADSRFRAHVGDGRIRLLRMGSDQPKQGSGSSRRATLYFRNYTRGVAHRVYVDLGSGALAITDLTSLVQPSREEFAAALEILRRDPEFAPYFADPTLEVSGGFYDRSRVADDPCAREVCLLVEVVRRRPRHGFERQIVVNLSRERIAHRDFHTPDPGAPPQRLSDPAED